jgi:hypothetical protein
MTVLGAGLLLAAVTGLWAYLRRPAARWQIIAGVVLQVAVLAQSVIAWFRAPGAGLGEGVTFVAYSIGILVPLPVGIWAARVERTRWGSTALAFTCLVVAVMTLRLYQLWRVHV